MGAGDAQIIPWGHHTWHAIHYVAMGYPATPSPDERAAYRAFFLGLGPVLPCKLCSANYVRHLQELPIDTHLDSDRQLFGWTVQLHNIVNRSLGKREWEKDEAYNHFMNLAPPAAPNVCPRQDSARWMVLVVIALLIVAVAVAWATLGRRRT
jgi:hypothetical protein